jgi:hypothetical protein
MDSQARVNVNATHEKKAVLENLIHTLLSLVQLHQKNSKNLYCSFGKTLFTPVKA